MSMIHLAAAAGLLLFILCYLLCYTKKTPCAGVWALSLFALALSLRLLAAGLSGGFDSDTACFASWADRIFRVGPGGFYSPDVFTDYPPGYMYLLYPVGALRSLLRIDYYSPAHLVLLRLPAILCDLGCGLLLYREGKRRLPDSAKALFLTAAYLFNPAILLNSSVWGQVDSVYTLLLLVMCLSLAKGRILPASLAFSLGILVKPQMLIFAPILLLGFWHLVSSETRAGKGLSTALLKCAGCSLASFSLALLPALPFGPEKVIRQYLSTLCSYPYAAVNAWNLWGVLGLNWVSQTDTFLGISYRSCGWAAILAAVAAVLFLGCRRKKDTARYALLAALLMTTVFAFSVRMHERYLFPALALLLLSCIRIPSRRLYLCYCGFSLLHFYNAAWVLFFYDPSSYDRRSPVILLGSAGILALTAFLYRSVFLLWGGGGRTLRASNARESVPDALTRTDVPLEVSLRDGFSQDCVPPEVSLRKSFSQDCAPLDDSLRKSFSQDCVPLDDSLRKSFSQDCVPLDDSLRDGFSQDCVLPEVSLRKGFPRALPPVPSRPKKKLTGPGLLCMLIVTLAYACFALFDLGDRQAPSTALSLKCRESILLDFGDTDPSAISALSCYIAPAHERSFSLWERSPQDAEWRPVDELLLKDVFTWQKIELSVEEPLLLLTLESDCASLLELVFTDPEGNPLTPVNALDYPALFDEQSLFPARFSFRNGMYFDEVYHGRTAYEFLNGLRAYETTHPPLGKLLIAAGVACFGMNPFGWRIAGALFGIAMVPLIWLFAHRITEHALLSTLASALFAFDFMHFTQTRLATIDVYITFFVLLMYFFLYGYSRLSFYDTPLAKTLRPLGCCGICMGLGVAAKWTGVYAGLGLAVLFFAVLLRRYREYLYAGQDPDGVTRGISHRHILAVFRSCTLRTLLFCCLFFVLVPAVIYLLSYLPFFDGSDDGLLLRLLHNQEYMLRYHSGLDATHAFSSPWYEWPLLARPIWYYSGIVTGLPEQGGIREGISAFGNPLVWWVGIPAAFCTLWLWTRKKDRTAAFLLTGYLAQYLPWFFVSRITFIYHYFPSVVFVVLMTVHCIGRLRNRLSERQLAALAVLYGASAFGLFLLFYPVLAGQPVDASYVDRVLRWFKSWVLVAK